ncbi:hypothetical protein BV22DRAFT_1108185 [Leucogyrophana mollusca]|uniref:Uncharacterized protein n=1 Tax=Leucogyrophana mollusca TaxID=85980 RepID=A0ACB8AZW5_9AGAM|nr:hypothetical protein BV22DRAFT_1108185 [Leucogyrophana mollusca]
MACSWHTFWIEEIEFNQKVVVGVHAQSQAKCPICSQGFTSPKILVDHLNDTSQQCCSEFVCGPIPVPPGLYCAHIGRGGNPVDISYHPKSGYTFGKALNILQQLEGDQYEKYCTNNSYWPFKDRADWELGKFLIETMNHSQTEKFLKLNWIEKREALSFMSKDQLVGFMDILPTVDSYPTMHPIKLIWRDALENISYDPHIVHNGLERKFGEWMTGDQAWSIQNALPEGATIVPIIAASDKTPVTRHTGNLELHPIFITLGNIQADVQMRATSHTWCCICMDIVFANCKVAAHIGQFFPDPCGDLRYKFTPLAAYIADLPEQQLLFQKASKQVYLYGILHVCLKFFFNHVLIWCKELLGHDKLNVRYQSQHKQVGTRHFSKGVSHHRDVQCTIVAVIAGAAPGEFVRAVWAMIDFIYLAQKHVHTPTTIKKMVEALAEFHQHKNIILEVEAHRGKKGTMENNFNIPKLELMQGFAQVVKQSGGLMQYTADGAPLINTVMDEDRHIVETAQVLAWIDRILPSLSSCIEAPRTVHNHFFKGILSDGAWTSEYKIHDFRVTFIHYIQHEENKPQSTPSNRTIQHGSLKVWYKFCLQLRSCLRAQTVLPNQLMQIFPPSEAFPHGNCDTVLVRDGGGSVSLIAQVRVVFQPKIGTQDPPLPPCLLQPLVYLYIAMYTVERLYTTTPQGCIWYGEVLPLTDITHPVELIPAYGEKIPWDASTALSQEV